MKYAWLDRTNNVIHIIQNPANLQVEFDQFVLKVQQQGKTELCVGEVHLVMLHDVFPEQGLLHFNRERPSRWDVKVQLPPYPG